MSNTVVSLQTTQGSSIKQLIECLSPLLTDINLIFYPKSHKNKGGICIKEINKQSSVLVHCMLEANKFETYTYNSTKDKIVVGINLNYLLKCLKCMNNFDIMTWEVNKDNLNELVINFELKTNQKCEKKIFKLNLMDLEYNDMNIDPINFSYLINMPSQDFQKYCKDMACATDKLELICNKNKLIFKGKGDLGSIEFQTQEIGGGMSIQITDNDCKLFQGFFELKYLLIFTKCTNLCNNLYLYLKNDYPLIIEYTVAALGKIKLVLSPSKS